MNETGTTVTGTKALPLDEITLLFYMPKEGTAFTDTNTLIRYLENRGCGVTVCTDPYGLVDTQFTPIVAEVDTPSVNINDYAGLVICPAQNGSIFENIFENVRDLLTQFNAAEKYIVCLGNACSLLFDIGLVQWDEAQQIEGGTYQHERILFMKDGDIEALAARLAEYLQQVRQQRTLQ